MTLFDIFALCAIGLSVILAMMRGLVGEVLSLVSWVLSLIAAKMAAQPLAETIFSFIRPSVLAAVAGFIAGFAAALLLLFFFTLPADRCNQGNRFGGREPFSRRGVRPAARFCRGHAGCFGLRFYRFAKER